MTKKQKRVWKLSIAIAIVFTVCPVSNAMHIMEGYLPPALCIAWGAVCLPFLIKGLISIKKIFEDNKKAVTLVAMAGAYVFVLSALKIPSVTGSCSHMTGTGFSAILFGPCVTAILGIIVLIFQAILLAHGGLTTLGANTFSMAIAGPALTYGIYAICKKMKVNRKVSIFLAAALGDLFTYCITSMQLAIAYPSAEGGVAASFAEFLGVFAPTQLPLAVIEGILTVLIMMALESYAKPELKAVGFIRVEETK